MQRNETIWKIIDEAYIIIIHAKSGLNPASNWGNILLVIHMQWSPLFAKKQNEWFRLLVV